MRSASFSRFRRHVFLDILTLSHFWICVFDVKTLRLLTIRRYVILKVWRHVLLNILMLGLFVIVYQMHFDERWSCSWKSDQNCTQTSTYGVRVGRGRGVFPTILEFNLMERPPRLWLHLFFKLPVLFLLIDPFIIYECIYYFNFMANNLLLKLF